MLDKSIFCGKSLLTLVVLASLFTASVGAYDRAVPAFDIPRIDGVKIDGQADDWKDDGFRVDSLPMLGCGLRPASDFDVRMRLGWDERGLLVLVSELRIHKPPLAN